MNEAPSAIRARTDNAVRILTLDAPPTNALSAQLLTELDSCLVEAEADGRVRAVLLESAGGRYFSSGLSLADLFARSEDGRAGLFKSLLSVHRRLALLPKPTVAAVGGRAILGGWILAMGADFRVLDDKGRIALSEVRYGLTPTEILLRRLASMCKDRTLLKDLALRGKTLNASAALAAGFVDRLVPGGEVGAAGLAEARALARSAPAAYARVKAALNRASGAYEDDLWEREMRDFEDLLATPEADEGLAAMREKRKPRWEEL